MPSDLSNQFKRCAIYTRKSTGQLLEHDVNSLVTQREICDAYVKSQRYRGWVGVDRQYDDAGHSGSGLSRPALIQLMQDIEAGLVDAVVVYKIDRLTRSLLDFVRLIEIFDRHGTALVSISQAFDTSDSMGRMILNVLLTFSQFERELIAERVRDSIRTRKRHGKIHGGLPPFGYDHSRSGLRVVPEEADIVRFVFSEFLRTRRYTAVMTAVREAGLRSSIKHSSRGEPRGDRPICSGIVYNILRNPIYVGEIRGHEHNYHGEHEPIISRETWQEAQAICVERTRPKPHSKQTNHFLASILVDDLGREMHLEVDWHRGAAYYCYASMNAAWSQAEFRRAYRSNAGRLEALVIAAVTEFLSDRAKLRAALKTLGTYGDELDRLAARGGEAASYLQAAAPFAREPLFTALINRIEVGEEHLSIDFRAIELRRLLCWEGKGVFHGRPADWALSGGRYELQVAACAISAERWPVINVSPRDPQAAGRRDPDLVKLIGRARRAQQLVEQHRDLSLDELAPMLGCRPGHFSRLLRLNYLAPDIVVAIIDGSQPSSLTRDVLIKANLPMDWSMQRRLLGFPLPRRARNPRNLFGRGMWPSKNEVGP
jgi:site-specific DNA recombinase